MSLYTLYTGCFRNSWPNFKSILSTHCKDEKKSYKHEFGNGLQRIEFLTIKIDLISSSFLDGRLERDASSRNFQNGSEQIISGIDPFYTVKSVSTLIKLIKYLILIYLDLSQNGSS